MCSNSVLLAKKRNWELRKSERKARIMGLAEENGGRRRGKWLSLLLKRKKERKKEEWKGFFSRKEGRGSLEIKGLLLCLCFISGDLIEREREEVELITVWGRKEGRKEESFVLFRFCLLTFIHSDWARRNLVGDFFRGGVFFPNGNCFFGIVIVHITSKLSMNVSFLEMSYLQCVVGTYVVIPMTCNGCNVKLLTNQLTMIFKPFCKHLTKQIEFC